MPLLAVLGMLLVYAIISAVENVGTQTESFTKTELDEISRLNRGKSQAEARRIIKQYRSTTNQQ